MAAAFPDNYEDQMVDGTLFKVTQNNFEFHHRVRSYTPVEGHEKPMSLTHIVPTNDAHDRLFVDPDLGNVQKAALAIGIEHLQPQIPVKLRQLKLGEITQDEMEALEGFGSF